jgi:Gram-negative bacterial TonB protein C-terminal
MRECSGEEPKRVRRAWALGLAVVLGLPCAAGSSAWAQSAPDSAACRRRLSAPSTDSDVVQLSLVVTPFDTARHVAAGDRSLLGEGVRQLLVLPAVLRLDVYDGRLVTTAVPTIDGVYRTTWRRDGRLTDARVVGGTRNEALDRALIAAITALDSSQMLPPPDSAVLAGADSVDLRILLTPEAVWSTSRSAGLQLPDEAGVTRLVRLRVPVRRVTGGLAVRSPASPPPYPPSLRDEGGDGQVNVQLVVDAAGVPDMRTVTIERADAMPFVEATLRALPEYRFSPLMVEGCAVAASVQLPFAFHVP